MRYNDEYTAQDAKLDAYYNWCEENDMDPDDDATSEAFDEDADPLAYRGMKMSDFYAGYKGP